MKIQESHRVSLKDKILFAEFDDGGVLFNIEDRFSISINTTGSSIIGYMDGEKDIGEITRSVAKLYEKPAYNIMPDILAFISNINERGWVHVR